MSSNRFKPAILAAFLSVGAVQRAEAQPPVGSRAAGMAGAFAGVADDASAVYWNPSGLATGALASFVIDVGVAESIPPAAGVRAAPGVERAELWPFRCLGRHRLLPAGVMPAGQPSLQCWAFPAEKRSGAVCTR